MAKQYSTKYKVKWVKKLNKCKTVRQFLDTRDDFYIENQHRFTSNGTNNVKSSISRLLRGWIKLYNSDMKKLESQTGKANGKGQGRPRKTEKNITWDDFTREELIEIANEWAKSQQEKSKKDRMKKQMMLNMSIIKRGYVFKLSKSGIYRYQSKGYKEKKLDEIDKKIISISENHSLTNKQGKKKYIIGRKGVYGELREFHDLSSRQIGNRMNKLGLKADQRQAKREKEKKDVDQIGENIANRDYRSDNIVSTDATYIDQRSERANNVYLVPAIHWGSRFILGFELSKFNDTTLVMDLLNKIYLPPKTILASDRGSPYSSSRYNDYIKEKELVKSLSRKGNCWDNLPQENWFGILKSECLHHYNLNKMSFEELKTLIKDWIYKYNYERKQEKLGWLTPAQVLRNNPSYMVHF